MSAQTRLALSRLRATRTHLRYARHLEATTPGQWLWLDLELSALAKRERELVTLLWEEHDAKEESRP